MAALKIGDRVKVKESYLDNGIVIRTFKRGQTYIVCEITRSDRVIVEHSGHKIPHPRTGSGWNSDIFVLVNNSFVLEEAS